MALYRKRPVVIEAVQYRDGMPLPGVTANGAGSGAWIETLEGALDVREGDWIITGVAGEIYPCKDAIFRQTYEPVDAEGERALNPEAGRR